MVGLHANSLPAGGVAARPSTTMCPLGDDGPMSSAQRPPTSTLPADPRHEAWMALALAAAKEAAGLGEVPVGAVVVRPGNGEGAGEVLSVRHNERESTGDPTAHAEALALRDAAGALGRWRLDDCLLVVTLEPCPMCAGALWASRIGGVVQAAPNLEAGALGSLYHLGADPRLNHEFAVRTGVRGAEAAEMLRRFFRDRRT
jgi:tRNA(adenine34) deaminase